MVAEVKTFNPNTVIVPEGALDSHIYIVSKGSIVVTIRSDHDVLEQRFSAGTCFNLISACSDLPSVMSIYSSEMTVVISCSLNYFFGYLNSLRKQSHDQFRYWSLFIKMRRLLYYDQKLITNNDSDVSESIETLLFFLEPYLSREQRCDLYAYYKKNFKEFVSPKLDKYFNLLNIVRNKKNVKKEIPQHIHEITTFRYKLGSIIDYPLETEGCWVVLTKGIVFGLRGLDSDTYKVKMIHMQGAILFEINLAADQKINLVYIATTDIELTFVPREKEEDYFFANEELEKLESLMKNFAINCYHNFNLSNMSKKIPMHQQFYLFLRMYIRRLNVGFLNDIIELNFSPLVFTLLEHGREMSSIEKSKDFIESKGIVRFNDNAIIVNSYQALVRASDVYWNLYFVFD